MSLPFLALGLLHACGGDPKPGAEDDTACTPTSWFLDQDGDGFGAGQAVEACAAPSGHVAVDGDCDDADATRGPMATELCDGLDNDCDDVVDPSTSADASTCHPDADLDGFGAADGAVQSCTCEDGYVLDATDCDDGDGAIHPGAAETWYDAVDSDCLGDDDDDADGDGFAWDEKGGRDCDDADPALHPDAVDHCGNGIDDNCDGEEATCGLSGTTSENGADMSVMNDFIAALGYVPNHAGDSDGDGIHEILLGRNYQGEGGKEDALLPRSDFVLLELPEGLDQPADWEYLDRTLVSTVTVATFRAPDSAGELETVVWYGTRPITVADVDLDGDGFLDYILASPQKGTDGTEPGADNRIDLVFGPASGDVVFEDPPAFSSPRGDTHLGVDMMLFDPPVDGRFAVVATTVMNTSEFSHEPFVYILDQDHLLSAADVDDAPRIFSQDGFKSGRGPAVGDVDGDGLADLLIGTRDPSGRAGSHASADLFLGPLEGDLDALDADLVIDQSAWMTSPKVAAGGGWAHEVLVDPLVDGALGPHIAVGLPNLDCDEGEGCGKVMLVEWTGPGWVDVMDAASVTLVGPPRAYAGSRVRWGGDVDADGVTELTVLAPTSEWPDTLDGRGAVFLLEPPIAGTHMLEDSDVVVRHASEHADDLGDSALVGHSLDGDEWDDLLVMNFLQEDALGNDPTRQGGFHVFRGGPAGF